MAKESKSEFKYDVAFSFLVEDEALATQINDLLADRFSNFLYSKKQDEIAGSDGEKIFNKVFSEEARVVVVLHRKSWGSTSWTRIEETAIRNRAFEKGYCFVVFIPLDSPLSLPKWLPKTQIWIGFDRYGLKGAASVIEARIQQEGGESREESVQEQAARAKRHLEQESKREEFLNSIQGVNSAKAEAKILLSKIEDLIKEIGSNIGLSFRGHRRDDFTLDFCSGNFWINIDWQYSYGNTLHDSALSVIYSEGPLKRAGVFVLDPPKILNRDKFVFNIDASGNMCWQKLDESFTSQKLAEHFIKVLISKIEKNKS